MTRRARALAAALLLPAVAACSSSSSGGSTTGDTVKEIAVNVLTLQSGTVTAIRERRGEGPFRDYAVPPAEMLDLATEVLQAKVAAVFPNPHAGEVIAKERKGKEASDDWYAPAWVSAVVVIVHPVPADPGRSRVEVHATNRGPFHRGAIDWEREVPSLLDAAVARRGRPKITPLR